jgi:hypothetical protein
MSAQGLSESVMTKAPSLPSLQRSVVGYLLRRFYASASIRAIIIMEPQHSHGTRSPGP